MTSSIRLKKVPEELFSSGGSVGSVSSVGIDPGVAPGFGFGDDPDADETAREFFIRTAIDVQFGKENGDFIVKAATIERLVDWLIINREDQLDSFALLRCYTSVTDSLKLFTLFQNRLTNGTKEEKLRVLRFFQLWIEKYFHRDFVNKKTNASNALCNRMLSLLLSPQCDDAELRDCFNSVKLTILRTQARSNTNGPGSGIPGAPKLTKLEVSGLEKLTTDKKAARKLDERLPEISLLELAGQLSKIEARMFARISERELYDLNWKKASNKHMCRHILRLIERTNNVSFWVATQILQIDPTNNEGAAEKRCARLKKFIKLAEKCLMLSNFNTLMEILGGINLRPIQRLKQTWALLPEKYTQLLKHLEEVTDNKHNYKRYRQEIKERKAPVLPYLGVYLRDLTFIEEGNTSFVDTMINFQKMKMISAVISELQEYQQPNVYSGYFPNLRSKERKYLKTGLTGLNEDPLYDLSYRAEAQASTHPPGTLSNSHLSSLSLQGSSSGTNLTSIYTKSISSDNLSSPATPNSARRETSSPLPILVDKRSSPRGSGTTSSNSSSFEETSSSILQRTNSERSVGSATPSPTPSPLADSALKSAATSVVPSL